ncbi:MAG TPA: hypothetical protein ENO16_02170, partial [Chromatiales bacterium]|nr:hypothetical protein [Chromatiales bacterium]
MSRPVMPWIMSLCILAAWSPGQAASPSPLHPHETALQMHRAGNPAGAADLLHELHRRHPGDQRILYDLIAALSAAGRDAEALALRPAAGDVV